MKTRTYFIIAGAALLGFAAWYHDFARRDARRREAVAAEQARVRLAETERRQAEASEAAGRARRETEERRHERALRAQEAALAQARREEGQSQLTAVRDENGALRASRHRLLHEIEAAEVRRSAQENERNALAREDQFLELYINEAAVGVARIGIVAEKVVQRRSAARTTTETVPPPR
jgi:hypothetical protein